MSEGVMKMEDRDLERRHLVAEAVRSHDLTRTEAWDSLLQLSSRANVESVETFEDEILLEGDAFTGALLWHVTLQFDDKGRLIDTSESFPGKFEGRFVDGTPSIKRMSVDTFSIFE
jgi:Predicted pPIWI-associating nuclease